MHPLLNQRRNGDPLRTGPELGTPFRLAQFMGDQGQLGRGRGGQLAQLGALVLAPLHSDAPIEGAGEGQQQQQREAATLQEEPAFELQRISR